MEDPPIAILPPQNPKKRFFGGSSNSSLVEPDVIEIPPPPIWKSRPLKGKSIIGHEVIVVDDEDSDDIMIIDEKVAPNSKGKKPMLTYLTVNDVIAVDGVPFSKSNHNIKGNRKSHESISANDFNEMGLGGVLYDDECALLQAHFDSLDVPPGIEATIPWWPASEAIENLAVSASSSSTSSKRSYSNFGVPKIDHFQAWSSQESLLVKKKISESIGHKSNFATSGVPTNSSFHLQSRGALPSIPKCPPASAPSQRKQATSSLSYKFLDAAFFSVGQNPSQSNTYPALPHVTAGASSSVFLTGHKPHLHNPSVILDGISAEISPPSNDGQGDSSENLILKKLELFKKFDTVEDHSDHYYDNKRETYKQSKSWAKKIQGQWRLLEKDLPDTIFVRVYEARMDLMRAVIVGADGTPYHDGLFFFDVYFTHSYPSSPPLVNYHAHGLRINPNLYDCGKVCLSLLGTWSGDAQEKWLPGKSTMLQVLVSIQGLILNSEPYYNEPGFAHSKNSPHGRNSSEVYSENAFLLSLKTMLYTMRRPPKYFEDLVFGHFYNRAHDILAACRAYLDGVRVGSFVKGKSQDAQERSKTCSASLRMNLPAYIKSFVEAFTKIGVKDCEKYLVPIDKDTYKSSGDSQRPRERKKH